MVLHLSPFFLGSRYQRDIPGKQEGGWPGEDIHHVQQRQGLAPPASSRCGPERQPSTLPAGQCPVSCEATGQTAYLGILHQGLYSTKEALGMCLVLGRDFLQLLGHWSVDSDCHIIWMESLVGFHKLLLRIYYVLQLLVRERSIRESLCPRVPGRAQ